MTLNDLCAQFAPIFSSWTDLRLFSGHTRASGCPRIWTVFYILNFFDSEHGLTYFLVKASVLGFGNTMVIVYVVFNHFLTMV